MNERMNEMKKMTFAINLFALFNFYGWKEGRWEGSEKGNKEVNRKGAAMVNAF